MKNYIDGFVHPVPRIYLTEYLNVVEEIARIWKEHGALSYFEWVGDDLTLEGVRSFVDMVDAKEDDVIVFGWVVFPSKEIRDKANREVPHDSRMSDLIAPLINPDRLIFDAERMGYGGFRPLVQLQ